MAGQGQFKRATASRWTSVNPILAIGELGLELVTNKMKFGDGITHWNDLLYANIGNTGAQGPQGIPGTGFSRQLSSSIDFGTIQGENQYIEKIITDSQILSSSVIIIQITDLDFTSQNVQCGVISITNGVEYKIYATAPDGANGIMSINILIF